MDRTRIRKGTLVQLSEEFHFQELVGYMALVIKTYRRRELQHVVDVRLLQDIRNGGSYAVPRDHLTVVPTRPRTLKVLLSILYGEDE